MNKEAEKAKAKYKASVQLSWGLTIAGLPMIVMGLIKLIWGSPTVGVNARYLQPVVNNGSLLLIVGLVFFGSGCYRLMNKRRIFQEESENENKIE